MPHSTASKVPTPDVGTHGINTTELVVVVFFFLLVSVLGFLAARWRKASQANHLDEWGLGGRSFGGWITWFLLGGDLYTAYTFVAVPAALTAGGRSASSPCRTRSSCGRWSSCSCRGCGRSRASAATSPPPTSSSGRHGSQVAGTRGRHRRRRGDDAVHRAAAGRHPGLPGRDRHRRQGLLDVRQGPPAVHRLRGAGGVHLHLGSACPGGDRVRQGLPDLPGHHRRGHLHPDPDRRRLARHLPPGVHRNPARPSPASCL